MLNDGSHHHPRFHYPWLLQSTLGGSLKVLYHSQNDVYWFSQRTNQTIIAMNETTLEFIGDVSNC